MKTEKEKASGFVIYLGLRPPYPAEVTATISIRMGDSIISNFGGRRANTCEHFVCSLIPQEQILTQSIPISKRVF